MITGVHTAADHAKFANVRTVFLDRDGVINRKAPEGEYVFTWEQFHLIPGSAEAIAALNASGRKIFIVTNQRGVSLGLYTTSDIDALHQRLAEYLAQHGAHVDGFYFCPHGKECDWCRKPGTGLFQQAFAEHPASLAESSVMIGDSLSDIEAGKRLQMRTIFIEGDPDTRKKGGEQAALLADASARSLAEAVELLQVSPTE